MKTVKLILFILVCMLASCSDRKNQETADYFLSQSRDPDLVGWWKYDIEENGSFFFNYKETGTIAELSYSDGKAGYYFESQYYWYTEKKNGRKILYKFRPGGVLYGSDYSNDYYEIRNDSLWKSSGIEGDKFYHAEMTFFVVKTTAPEGYENR
jgi:hypothetical protein